MVPDWIYRLMYDKEITGRAEFYNTPILASTAAVQVVAIVGPFANHDFIVEAVTMSFTPGATQQINAYYFRVLTGSKIGWKVGLTSTTQVTDTLSLPSPIYVPAGLSVRAYGDFSAGANANAVELHTVGWKIPKMVI